jgi:hypothetical protein
MSPLVTRPSRLRVLVPRLTRLTRSQWKLVSGGRARELTHLPGTPQLYVGIGRRHEHTERTLLPVLPGSLASKDDARVDAGGTARGLPRRDDGHRQNSNRRSSRDRRQGKSLEKVVGQQDTECRKTKWQP